ncbi:hypothetical protein [Kordiimonas sp. SCSIO 12610]|uniref:hypothetical protein n=1 Tax=Kordiimonas sp. SCSIO 12610 TaxID=2829597 RepID=UPI00210E5C31|nr:hypothetical protein [Kordiimonas sp. SCSIO 12610]UTW55184.1 hypothetical protein KFF44_15475 [Kordiimonas sp. SCSIO 12610]
MSLLEFYITLFFCGAFILLFKVIRFGIRNDSKIRPESMPYNEYVMAQNYKDQAFHADEKCTKEAELFEKELEVLIDTARKKPINDAVFDLLFVRHALGGNILKSVEIDLYETLGDLYSKYEIDGASNKYSKLLSVSYDAANSAWNEIGGWENASEKIHELCPGFSKENYHRVLTHAYLSTK